LYRECLLLTQSGHLTCQQYIHEIAGCTVQCNAFIGIAVLTLLSTSTFLQAQQSSAPTSAKCPNIVFMLTDNLGYGDVGAYGGGAVRGAPTQHIDTLASEGLQLTNFSAERATIVKLLQQGESRTISTALV
jgi:hypothetical protein